MYRSVHASRGNSSAKSCNWPRSQNRMGTGNPSLALAATGFGTNPATARRSANFVASPPTLSVWASPAVTAITLGVEKRDPQFEPLRHGHAVGLGHDVPRQPETE